MGKIPVDADGVITLGYVDRVYAVMQRKLSEYDPAKYDVYFKGIQCGKSEQMKRIKKYEKEKK